MIEATTEAHIRHAMHTAHYERAQAFAKAGAWVMSLFRSRKAREEFGAAVPC